MINKLLLDFFYTLNKEKVVYAFLRSYEKFLQEEELKDLDIVIDWKMINKFEKTLFDFFYDTDFIIYKKGHWPNAIQYNIFDIETGESILLDVRKNYTYKNKVLIENSRLVKDLREYKELKILNSDTETEMLVYHVFFKQRYKKEYIDKLRELGQLSNEFTSKLEDRKVNINMLFTIYPQLQNKLNSKLSLYEKLLLKMKSVFQHKPLVIVLLGPDGAGKSTIGIRISELLQEINIDSDYFHFALGKNSIYQKNIPVAKDSPKKDRIKEKVPAFILYVYRIIMKIKREFLFTFKFIKYNKNYLVNIFSNQNNKKISIVDRFPLNSCINKKTLKYESLWRKILKNLVYKPSKIYFLHADSEIIYKRKQELSIDEISNFMNYEVQLIKETDIPYDIIDVSSSNIDKIAWKIIQDILEKHSVETIEYIRQNNEKNF